MKTQWIKAFKCNHCEKIHETYNDAIDCCIEIENTFIFKCGKCSKIFYNKNDTDWCCVPKEFQPEK